MKKEFEDTLRKITMIDRTNPDGSYSPGYGLLCICHSQQKSKVIGNDTVDYISPAMPERAADVVNRLVDLIGYINIRWDENGNVIRELMTRSSPTILAGSRLPYLPAVIPFSYESLVNNMADAIDKQGKEGATIIEHDAPIINNERSYEDIADEAKSLWNKLTENNPTNADRIMDKVEGIFGQRIKLSQITTAQKDLYELVVAEMRDM